MDALNPEVFARRDNMENGRFETSTGGTEHERGQLTGTAATVRCDALL